MTFKSPIIVLGTALAMQLFAQGTAPITPLVPGEPDNQPLTKPKKSFSVSFPDDDLVNQSPESNRSWRQLESDFKFGKNKSKANPSRSAKSRREEAQEFVAAAKKFRREFPNHPRAAKARRMEVLSLLEAADFDSDSFEIESALSHSAMSMRGDEQWPERERAEIAGFFDSRIAFKQISAGEPEDKVLERLGRRLIGEFPNQPQGYRTLMTLARQSDADKAEGLLEEIINSNEAPEEIQNKARKQLRRHLVTHGEPLPEQLISSFLSDPKQRDRSRPFIVYTWSTEHPGSHVMVQNLSSRGRGKWNFVGINLSRWSGEEETLGFSRQTKFPGQQLIGEKRGELLDWLGLDTIGQVALVSANGIVQKITQVYDYSNVDQALKVGVEEGK